MKTESNTFWRNYRRNAILGWVFLILTPVVPVTLGVISHFTIGTNSLVSHIGELSGLVPFFLFIYYALKFKFAECPHCHQTVAKFKNLVFPIDPVCPKCGKRMDIDEVE